MNEIILGKPIIHLQSVDSTNNYAARLLKQETVTEGTVILADHQTQGRGQAGNHWVSEEGKNLLLSVILKPAFLPAYRQFYLSMCVANALCALLKGYGMASCIKWPNDLLVNRKKVAGILIENSIMGQNLDTSIIGMGINVNQTVFPDYLLNPTSLKLETGMEQDPGRLLQELLASLGNRLNQLYSNSLGIIRKDYLNNLWKLNIWSNYSDPCGDFEGRITDISEAGELIVKKRSGEILPYQFKEIVFRDET